jgi:hypothetical protein
MKEETKNNGTKSPTSYLGRVVNYTSTIDVTVGSYAGDYYSLELPTLSHYSTTRDFYP